LKLVGVPAVVGLGDLVLPVVLDEVDEFLTVSRSWVRDVVI